MSRFVVIAVIALALVAASAAYADMQGFAWVSKDGKVSHTGQKNPLNVTRLQKGIYCWNNLKGNPSFGTFAAVVGSVQASASYEAASTGGNFIANSGWGNSCNPLGGNAIYILDNAGHAADLPFSFTVNA